MPAISDLIAPFRPADGAPPRQMRPFMRWALAGAFPVIALASVISMASGAMDAFTALFLGWVVDATLATDGADYFAQNGPLLIGAVLFFLAVRPIIIGSNWMMLGVVLNPSIFSLVLSRLNRHVLGHDIRFFDGDFAGRLAQKQIQAARATTDLVTDFVQAIVYSSASLIASTLVLMAIDGTAALLLALWILAYIALLRHYMPKVRDASAGRAAARATVTGHVVDTATNIRTVKLFGHSSREDETAVEAMKLFRKQSLQFGGVSARFRFWLIMLAGALPISLVGLTLFQWTHGAATPGDIAAAGTIALKLVAMTGWISATLMAISANLGEAEDAIKTLAAEHGLADRENATELEVSTGSIRFEGVRFSHEGGQGLKSIDLDIRSGEKVGLVGASGAGKSTLVSTLLRLYDIDEGAVLIDGTDIRDVTQDSLRRQIGVVTQDTSMFNRSVRDNIAYGHPDATQADIETAAQRAEAHDFILELTDSQGRTGYDAHLGERGVRLSGGQRQRIALARAILKDAPILVLDEATSALDSKVESQIQSALEKAMDGKTVISIAHRLSTLSNMDRIVVMDSGEIAECGTHDDLMSRDGIYADFWKRQLAKADDST